MTYTKSIIGNEPSPKGYGLTSRQSKGADQRSFTFSLHPYERALLKDLLNDTRHSFTLEDRGSGLGESFSLKVHPYEHALLNALLRDARRSFTLSEPDLLLGESFTLTVRPYEYELLQRQAVVLFAIFLPIHMDTILFDQVKKTFVSRADHGISEFIRHDSGNSQYANAAHRDGSSYLKNAAHPWPTRVVSGRRDGSPYLKLRPNWPGFRSVPCCFGMALSLRQSSWVDLHMLERYLL